MARTEPARRRTRPGRRWSFIIAVLPAALTMCVPAGMSQALRLPPRAQAAAHTSVKDEGKLHLVKSSGSTLYDEGSAHGTFPGRVKIRFVYTGSPNVTATITIYAHGGSIVARGSARLSNPTSATPSFKGTLTISSGTGRYDRAHGSGHLYGVYYRRTYAITVQTEGAFNY